MIHRFFDSVSGGFFDTPRASENSLGILGTQRKPLQDSPTPAGNSVAAIALLRMYAYTNDHNYSQKAQQTLELFAGMAEQYAIFAATYGIAAVYFSQPHIQVLIVGSGEAADRQYAAAIAPFALNKAVVHFNENEVAAQNLPPALATTISHAPTPEADQAIALVCSGFTCQPPVSDADRLAQMLREQLKAA
jgi:uncharacterized protein YyaL (SSP411 family)